MSDLRPNDESMPELVNPVIRRMSAGELAVGLVLRLARSGDIARIAKASGLDFLFIDTQHALFSLETIGNLAHVALGCDLGALVRVRGCHDPDLSLVLDCGASGVVVPDVNTAEEARLAVARAKFAPVGRRSLQTGHAQFDYRPWPPDRVIRALNDYTIVVCMIETVEGLENVEEIAAVDGVDVLLVGLTDLLADMGKAGALGDPQAMEAVRRILAAARTHGKFSGVGGDANADRQAVYVSQGARFFTLLPDQALLMAAASTAAADLRAIGRTAGTS